MIRLLARRWPTFLLLAWLPLVKWGLPAGWPRLLLFFGGGSVLAALAVSREGDWPRVRPLLAGAVRGVLAGLWGFALLVAGATVLLYFPPIQPLLPVPLYDLAVQFDPMPLYLAYAQGDAWPQPATLARIALGSVAEEWIFRVGLFWRWLPPALTSAPPRLAVPVGALLRLLALSAYFAALHWPQSGGAMLIAGLGSLVVGLVLLWKRNFALVATLHVLFNWRLLI